MEDTWTQSGRQIQTIIPKARPPRQSCRQTETKEDEGRKRRKQPPNLRDKRQGQTNGNKAKDNANTPTKARRQLKGDKRRTQPPMLPWWRRWDKQSKEDKSHPGLG